MDIQTGDIVFSGRRSGFYPNAVRFFTQSKWSHCFFIMGMVADELAVLEADMHCQVVPFHREYEIKNDDYYEIYRPIKVSNEEIKDVSNNTYIQFSGEIYGFLQPLWFAFDSICKKIGINSGRQWFPNGIVCSGVLAAFLLELNSNYKEAFKEYETINRVNPEELYQIVKTRPDLFEYIGKRD